MRVTRALALVTLAVLLLDRRTAAADEIDAIIGQAALPEYQSYLRVLTGVDPVPGTGGHQLQNRWSRGTDIRIAGQWLNDQFASFGLAVEQQSFRPDYGPNVVAELPGTTRPEDIYLLCAHYDTYHRGDQLHAPGCDDNGSGTAGVLMAARILAQYPFEGTIRFIAFSGEEQWMIGSQAYARAAAAAGENIVGVINLDMILHPTWDNYEPDPDYDLDIESNGPSLPLAEYVADQFGAYTSIDVEVHNDPENVSDHWAFWQEGYRAVGLSENTTQEIWGHSNDAYHQLSDTMDNPDYDWAFGLETIRGGMASIAGLAGLVPEPSACVLLIAALLPALRSRRRTTARSTR